jgi:alkylation response protein AidB-like acyl-CoA dehydrogenase
VTATLVLSTAAGLRRRMVPPAGLAGWSWGTLQLIDVAVAPEDLVGEDGGGSDVFHEHFAHYRPLVTMTALGAAASVHATVAATMRARVTLDIVRRPRDTALVALGRAYAELNSALLSSFAALALGDRDPSTADLWARAVKAYGVDAAYRAATELPLLVGARAFGADSPLTKARNDLAGLLYADGIHDSLYRSAGRTLTAALPDDQPPGRAQVGTPFSRYTDRRSARAERQATTRRPRRGDSSVRAVATSTNSQEATSPGAT